MASNEHFETIVLLEDEIEAQILSRELTARGVPHVLRSYHDSALDGIFQQSKGWGRLEAPAEFKETILAAYAEIKREQPLADDDPECEAVGEEPAPAAPEGRSTWYYWIPPLGFALTLLLIYFLLRILGSREG